jgi:large subunit ribosomal protein L6
MSRIGRQPIAIPPGVNVAVTDHTVTISGPKGTLSQQVHPAINVRVEDGKILVERQSDLRQHRALHGLSRTLIANMVEGVTKGFSKSLDLVGVGYRAQKVGNRLVLQVGFSHPVEITPPPGIDVAVEGTNRIIISGIDKQLVGQFAAEVRAIRPPDPYKGKGIRYTGEEVRLKAGKAGKAGKGGGKKR